MPLIASSLFDFVCARKALLVLGRCVGDEGRGMVLGVPTVVGGQKMCWPERSGCLFSLIEISAAVCPQQLAQLTGRRSEAAKNVRFVVKNDDCASTVWLSCY